MHTLHKKNIYIINCSILLYLSAYINQYIYIYMYIFIYVYTKPLSNES